MNRQALQSRFSEWLERAKHIAMKKAWFLSGLLLAGCVQLPEPSSPRMKDGDAAFSRLADAYISGYLAWRPQTGTSLGFHEYDGKLTDFNRPSLDAELARLKSFDQPLAALDTNNLSPQALYDYSNLAESLPRPQTETAIDEANGAVDFLSKDLVEALKGVKDEKLMAQFNSANQQAIAALKQYVVYLKEQKLPKANDHYALGREKYIELLRYGEMVTLSPEQLLEIGTRELQRKQQVFAEAARQIDPTKKPVEVFQAIQKDHPTAQNLIPDTAKDLGAIRQFVIDRKIVTIPSSVPATVLETPQFLRATSFASMDTPGPFEKKATEAYYYVTPVEEDWPPKQKEEWLTAFNYYTTDIVSIHEAYPGHYVQFLCLNASPATKLEKIFSSYAFVEGWAHYTEQMMVDEGFGGPPTSLSSSDRERARERGPIDNIRAAKYRLAQTDEALLRVCRLCVSIKLHCQGMTVDEATKFFQENCYYEEKPARQEAMRGAYDPEYLYYTLGKLEILKLREDYRQQQGTNFTLEKFHNEMLRHGAPPIRLLREVMLKNRNLWNQPL